MTPEVPEGFETGVMPIKDFRMHYVRGGSGPVVVIVHGGWSSWWAWREVMPVLAERYTVVLPDLRGLAHSTKPLAGYEADTIGDDLNELIRALGYDRVSLVGDDWGAMACYILAAQQRDLVERLAIFDMAIPGASGLLEQLMTPQPNGAFIWHMGFLSIPDIPEMLIAGHVREMLQWFYTVASGAPGEFTTETLDYYVDLYSGPGAMKASLQYYRNLWVHAEQVRKHKEKKLTIPVMAYGGDMSLGDQAAADLVELVDDVRGGTIPMCGHWIAEERPEFVTARLLEFLGE